MNTICAHSNLKNVPSWIFKRTHLKFQGKLDNYESKAYWGGNTLAELTWNRKLCLCRQILVLLLSSWLGSERLLQAKQTQNRTGINQNDTLLTSIMGNIFLELECKSQHSKTFLFKYEGMCRIKLVNINTRWEYWMARVTSS